MAGRELEALLRGSLQSLAISCSVILKTFQTVFLGSLLNSIRVLNTVHTTHKSVKSFSVIVLIQNGLGDIDR